MSDEDRDVDIESDEEDEDGGAASQHGQEPNATVTDKRAHHNALERKRRDHIKDSFHNLRDSVPDLQGEKVSRAQILKKAADYIVFMRDKNTSHQKDIEAMKRANQDIQNQIKTLERFSATSQYSSRAREQSQLGYGGGRPVSESSEDEDACPPGRKKQKVSDS